MTSDACVRIAVVDRSMRTPLSGPNIDRSGAANDDDVYCMRGVAASYAHAHVGSRRVPHRRPSARRVSHNNVDSASVESAITEMVDAPDVTGAGRPTVPTPASSLAVALTRPMPSAGIVPSVTHAAASASAGR